jgi:hypothetical protein
MSFTLNDYLEAQIIIDFHFRGEQDVFEAEYPHLKEKAVEILTPQLYKKLSFKVGEPLRKEMPEYGQLFKIYERV